MVVSERLLPWDLVEEILSCVPLKSLIRFKTVCKRWKALFEEKRFANNQLARASRPQFILFSKYMICSVDVILDDCPSIKVRKVPLDITCHRLSADFAVDYCDGLLLFAIPSYGLAVCNPWLKQATWIKKYIDEPYFNGIGYDSSRSDDSCYKIFASPKKYSCNDNVKAWITEFGSNIAWKLRKFESETWCLISDYSVSLNGTLYWISCDCTSSREYFITSFDFSTEKFNKCFCALPGKTVHALDGRSLEVFRGDRFSYLHQCYVTKNIEIWVTKRKIENEDGESCVEWMKFMNVSIPNSSDLKDMFLTSQRSYFIDEKRLSLVLCCQDSEGHVCIYIAKGDKSTKFKIEAVSKDHCRHRTYFPSLVQVPLYQRK